MTAALMLTPVLGITAGAPPAASAPGDTTTLLVLVDPHLSESEQEAVIAEQPSVETSTLAPVGLHEVVVDADDAAAALSAFNADELVVSASVDFTREIAGSASDPEYGTQWALPQIGWEDVHGVASYAGNVNLAVLDTGVDASAPDLAGRVGPGWSFDGSDPGSDPHGHGTHTATIAAASADDGVGIAGVAYANTTVMPVKVLGADGTGTDSDVIAGLVWATDNGADVAVMPFAAAGYSAPLQAAIDYAWANGVVLVAAAGNDGSTTPSYPAGSARVVGVGATGSDDAMWPASNQSDAVFINAPGVGVLASDSGGTVSVTGTSASAAVTAGAAALLRAIDPDATNAMIVGRLARWADPITGPGNGRLDVGAASTDTSDDGATPLGAPEGGPIVSSYVAAVARTWTGAGGTNFNAPGSWSPAGVPTAADALTVPGAVASGNYPVVNATSGSGLAASLVIQNGATVTVTASTLASSGIITVNPGGTLSLSNIGTITVPNNIVNDGTFTISGSATTVTIPNDYLGTGVATMANGTLTVGRNWRPSGGSFTATGGTVRFTGLGDTNANFAGAPNQFFNVTVDAGANPRFGQAVGSAVNISSTFTNSSSTLSPLANATFTLNGTANQTVTSAATAGTFGNLVVNKTAGTLSLASDARASGNVTVSAGIVDTNGFALDRLLPGGTFTMAAGTLLEVGGTGGFPANYATRALASTSHVRYDGTNQPVIDATYGHLTLTGTGVKTMPAAPIGVVGNFMMMMSSAATAVGPISVAGNATFGPSTTFDGGPSTHHVGGTFANQSSTWSGGTSTFVLDGSAAQAIVGLGVTPFHNLTIDNPNGVTLSQSIRILGGGSQGLELLDGNITTGVHAVIVEATGAVNRTSGHVVGDLRKQISSNGTLARTYEVGTATSYLPVDLVINGISGSATGGLQNLTVSALSGDHPNLATSGIDGAQSVNAHWRMTVGGTWTFTDHDATFGFTAADVDAGADTSVFTVRRYTGGTWFATPAGTRTPTSTQSTGNPSFSDFAVGEPSGDPTTTALSCPATLTYGSGGVCTATVSTAITGVAPAGTVAFTSDGSGTFSPATSCTLAPVTDSTSSCSVTYTPTAVGTGTHQVEAAFNDGIEYTPSLDDASIAVSPAAVTITADDQSRPYGDFDPVFTFAYAGLTNGDTGTATPPTCSVAGPHDDVAGSPYPITCSGAADPNYTITYVDGELAVTTGTLTVTADDQTKVYGDFDPVFTFTYAGLTNGDLGPATAPTCTVAGAHDDVAGSPYSITCSGASDPNYSIAYVDGDLSVTPAPLTVTADDQTRAYGAADPAFTFSYSGLTNGDVGAATAPTCGVTGIHDDVLGSPYPITCSGASDPNYSIAYADGALTVTPVALSVTADDQSKVYGDFDPPFTFGYAGLTNGDAGPEIAPACTVVGPHEDVAGSPYPISCSGGVDPNYTFTYADGVLTVTPASLTITADDQTKVYGDFDPVFTFAYSGLTYGDTDTATPPTCGVAGPHDDVAGSPYPITCAGAVDSNYSISYAPGDLSVTPAPLTITANNQTKVAGDPDPPFTFAYGGLANGDTGTATPPTCTVVGPHDTAGGSPYPITCSGAVDANYSISYVDGILTVTPATAAPTVVSIDRADPDPTSAAIVEWTVSFSSGVTGVGVGDFSLAGTGTAGASIVGVSADSGSTRTVTVMTGAPGTLALHLNDDDSIVDAGLTPLSGTGTGTVGSGGAGNGSFAGQPYTIDPAPTATVTAPAGMEGIAATVTGTLADDDPVTFTWSFAVVSPEGATCTQAGTLTLTPTVTCNDDAEVTATLSVDDGVTVVTASAVLVIANVAPDAGELVVPGDPIRLGLPASVSATFGDVGSNDTHTVTIDWGDGSFSGPGATTSPMSAVHTYAVPGVYDVTATFIDDDTGSDVSVTDGYIVVYDPLHGHVTGGGRLVSPAGAYVADPTLTGSAEFGFNAQYKRRAVVPTGSTEFTLKVCEELGGGDHDGDNDDEHDCGRDRDGRDGDDRRDRRNRGDDHDDDDGRPPCVARGFNFKSTSYEWLVVPGSTEATYQGVGRLNGVGGYAFTVTVRDGGSSPGTDLMRVQIWDPTGSLVYDNQMGDPYDGPATRAISKGSIKIHGI